MDEGRKEGRRVGIGEGMESERVNKECTKGIKYENERRERRKSARGGRDGNEGRWKRKRVSE